MELVKGTWNKPKGPQEPEQMVEVMILGTAQASNSDGQIRPVAVIADLSDHGRLRYVELKFVQLA